MQGDRKKGITLLVIYNPFLRHLGQTIRRNLLLLYQDEEVKRVFTLAPFFSVRTARTLRTHVVRAKVYPAEERLVESRKCLRNRCQVCKNVVERDNFQSFVNKMVYKINHRFTCSDKCWSVSYHVKLVDGNILVKQLISSDIDGTIIRIIAGKV